jgi:GNAT superfamily N-acetyltransferase
VTRTVVVLEPTAVPDVVDVLHESFFDYPVMRFVLGDEEADYDRRLRMLVNFFVMARVFRNEVLIGVHTAQELVGTALISRPGGPGAPREFYQLREEVWSALGQDAEARYGSFGEACAPFQVDAPHLHLNMIGVRERAQGTGVSRRLIEAVHEHSRTDPNSVGVTLTTEDPGNVALYEYFGYEIVGQAVVASGLTTWGFFRPD